MKKTITSLVVLLLVAVTVFCQSNTFENGVDQTGWTLTNMMRSNNANRIPIIAGAFSCGSRSNTRNATAISGPSQISAPATEYSNGVSVAFDYQYTNAGTGTVLLVSIVPIGGGTIYTLPSIVITAPISGSYVQVVGGVLPGMYNVILRSVTNSTIFNGGPVVFSVDNIVILDDPNMPVLMSPLIAEKRTDGIHFSWTTYMEINNDHFSLDRSVDGGMHWKRVAIIKSLAPGGNAQYNINYNFTLPFDIAKEASMVYLFILMLVLGGISLVSKAPKKIRLAILCVLAVCVIACSKNNQPSPDSVTKAQYRLTQYDIDGTTAQSKIIVVQY